jgi:hypothetical protein
MKLVTKKVEEKKKTVEELVKELHVLGRHLQEECPKCDGTGRPRTKTGNPAKTGKNVKCKECYGTGISGYKIDTLFESVTSIKKDLKKIGESLRAHINKQSVEIRVLPEGNNPRKQGDGGWEGYSGTFDIDDEEERSIIIDKARMHFDTYFKDGFYHSNKRLGIFLSSSRSGKHLVEEMKTEK